VDVVENKDKLPEMLEYSQGSYRVPVIVQGEQVDIGYGGS